MKKKILFIIFAMFMFIGIVQAGTTDAYLKIGMDETITLDPNTIANTSGKTYNFTPLNEDSTGFCYKLTSAGVLSGSTGGVQYPEGCEITVTATSTDNEDVVIYHVEVVKKLSVSKNGGTLVCDGASTDPYITGYGPYNPNTDPAEVRVRPIYSLLDVFPLKNLGMTGYNCRITKEGSNFAGWYSTGENSKLLDATTPINRLESTSIEPHWSDSTFPVESIEIEDFVGAGIVALNKGDDRLNKLRLGVVFTPYYATNQNLTWSSSNESVATVSADGIVTALANGDTTIKAVSEDGGKEATIIVRVTDNDYNYYLFPQDPVAKVGDSVVFKAFSIGPMVAPADTKVVFESSDGTIAAFEADAETGFTNGTMKTLKQGRVTVSAIIGEGASAVTITTTLNVTDSNGHSIEDIDYLIEFEGGEGATGTMGAQPHYKNEKLVINKNQFKKENYIFSHWKVYMENADGTRVPVKPDGENQMTLKDGEEMGLLNIPEGSKLVLVAEWTTNPNTGYIIPVAIGILAILAGYLYFIKAKKYNKIAKI